MDKLPKREGQELILDLIYGFALCKTTDEAVIFLEDLITKKELEMLSKRLRIAKLLLEGHKFREIENILNVSHGTVAKISFWLSERGEGFRKVIRDLPKKEQAKEYLDYGVWEDLKRKYPSYFLPEIIVENLSTRRRQMQELKKENAVRRLDESLSRKKKINKEISDQLKDIYKK